MRFSQFVPAAAMAATHFINAPEDGATCWSASCPDGNWEPKNYVAGFAIGYCNEFWNSPSGQKTVGYASAVSVGSWDDPDSCISSFISAVSECYNSGIGVRFTDTNAHIDVSWTDCIRL